MIDAEQSALVVLLTAASREEAGRLAEMLIAKQLAACVQILPQIESIYRWKGETLREPEFLLLAKTVADKFGTLEREVRAMHSYKTPEIIGLPVAAVSGPYFEWLVRSVTTNVDHKN